MGHDGVQPGGWSADGGHVMDRRRFLKSSLAGAAAAGWWLNVPSLARAKGREELIRMTERPLNFESVRSTFTTRVASPPEAAEAVQIRFARADEIGTNAAP